MVKCVWQQNETSSQGWVDRSRRVSFAEEVGSSHRRIPNYNPQYATHVDPRAQYRPSPQPSKEQKRPSGSRVPVILPGQPDPSEIPRRTPTPPRPPMEYLVYGTTSHREPGSDSDSSSDDEDSEPPPAPRAGPKLTIRIPPLPKDRPKYIPELDEVVTMGKRRREADLPSNATSATPASSYTRERSGVSVETFEVADQFEDDDMEIEQPLATTTQGRGVDRSNSRSASKSNLRRRARPQKRLSGSYASFGMSSPLKPEGVTSYYTSVCTMPGCMFVATSDAHLKHHMRTFQHGKISLPGRFDDEMIEEDVKDDPMEMI